MLQSQLLPYSSEHNQIQNGKQILMNLDVMRLEKVNNERRNNS